MLRASLEQRQHSTLKRLVEPAHPRPPNLDGAATGRHLAGLAVPVAIDLPLLLLLSSFPALIALAANESGDFVLEHALNESTHMFADILFKLIVANRLLGEIQSCSRARVSRLSA